MAKQRTGRTGGHKVSGGKERRLPWPFWVSALVAAGALLVWLGPWQGKGPAAPAGPPPVVEEASEVFAQYAGSASCRECHPEAYVAWAGSHHGLAERPVQTELDDDAFVPGRTFEHGNQTSRVFHSNGLYQVSILGLGGSNQTYAVERVVGVDPLRQFLVDGPRGRLQTLEVAWDPHRKEWFNVYGDENRQPGEWGHWTGRGMAWNTMCATCHNTRLRKNYDSQNDHFETRMAEMGVGCEACHGPSRDHVEYYRAYEGTGQPPPLGEPLSRHQMLDTCGGCHSRRYELTGDFVPGDRYDDHHVLTIVDGTDLYYPDGQVRDENYEFSSFLSSRMHAAGVTCLDCHHPHMAKPMLKGNLLCMRCHSPGGYPNSPVIDLATHTFHAPDSAGSQCVNCHMPQTVYMQRDPRHDHGFTIPDPLLTKELGIPNACNRCHVDRDVDWTLAAVEQWYGPRMERYTRQRTRVVAAARRGEEAARDPLLELLGGEDTPYWKAVAANLLDLWTGQPKVRDALLAALEHTNALVRLNAAHSLAPLAEDPAQTNVRNALHQLQEDPVRAVRHQAAWALRQELDLESLTGREMLWALRYNGDFPSGQMQLGALALSRTNHLKALVHYQKAVDWDPNSAPLRHELAVVLSMVGRQQQALEQMQQACRLNPDHAEFRFKLGLAFNEVGRLKDAIGALQEAVRLDPRHARAWYNLGLAQFQDGHPEEALETLARAENANPQDPGLPYTRATLLAQLGRLEEAQRAAGRALDIDPGFTPARQFMGLAP